MATSLIKAFEKHLRELLWSVATEEARALIPAFNDGADATTSNILLYYEALWNSRESRIEPKPRRVLYSAAYRANPRREALSGRIELLERLLQSGDARLMAPDLRFLSQRVQTVLRAKDGEADVFIDQLRHGWDVWHFHLGEDRRTNDLLFAMVDDASAYFIDIGQHYPGLYDIGIIETAWREWPHLFQHRELKGILGGRNPQPKEERLMRTANFSRLASFGGRTFMADPVAKNGTPIAVSSEVEICLIRLQEIEEGLGDCESSLMREVARIAGFAPEQEMDLAVVETPENFGTHLLLVERRSGAGIKIPL